MSAIMEKVVALVLSPFEDIVQQGTTAARNSRTGKNLEMHKCAVDLMQSSKKALERIKPACERLLEENGMAFVLTLQQNSDLARIRLQLNLLVWDFDHCLTPESFDSGKFHRLHMLTTHSALHILEILAVTKPSDMIPTASMAAGGEYLPSTSGELDAATATAAAAIAPAARAARASFDGALPAATAAGWMRRGPGSSPLSACFTTQGSSLASSQPIRRQTSLTSLGRGRPRLESVHELSERPITSAGQPRPNGLRPDGNSGIDAPGRVSSSCQPEADCTITDSSSFHAYKKWCPTSHRIVHPLRQFSKVGRSSNDHWSVEGVCLSCAYTFRPDEVEEDLNGSSSVTEQLYGIEYRPRFLAKSHLPSAEPSEKNFGCVFCIHQGKTTQEHDATVFFGEKELLAHIARHPHPLPDVPDFKVEYVQDDSGRSTHDFDLCVRDRQPPQAAKVTSGMQANTGKATIKQTIRGTGADHLPAGARVVCVSFTGGNNGKQCVGRYDGRVVWFSADAAELDPPSEAKQRDLMQLADENVRGVAREAFSVKGKFGSKKTKGAWLNFEKGEVITNLSYLAANDWLCVGTNARGKRGFFPSFFLEPATVKRVEPVRTWTRLSKRARGTEKRGFLGRLKAGFTPSRASRD